MSNSSVFTDTFIRSLTPSSEGPFEKFDKKVRGMGIRVYPGGARSFIVLYRIGGRCRRLTLGRYDAISLKEARSLARDALSQVRRGVDPAAERKRARDDYQGRLFSTLLDDFIENYAKRNTRSWKETERILRREFEKPWRRLRIEQIKKQHVNDVLNSIARRGAPSSANHALSHIRKVFNWCVETGHLEVSPCSGMKKPCKVESRDRVLSNEELAAVWFAADKMAWPFGPVIQLLILTLQRRSEVAGMRWDEVDLLNGLWELPPGSFERIHKSSRRHFVPLSKSVFDLLQSLPRIHDEFLFPARGKDNPISGYSKWKEKLDELSGVHNWTIHDLRRTAATGMAKLKVPDKVIDLIQNHKAGNSGGVTGIYNRYPYLDERREALELWARHLEEIIRRAQKSNETSHSAVAGKDIDLAHSLR